MIFIFLHATTLTFSKALEDTLINKTYLQYKYMFPDAISSDDIYDSQFAFFEKANKDKEYFDTNLNLGYKKMRIKGMLIVNMPRIVLLLRKIKQTLIK